MKKVYQFTIVSLLSIITGILISYLYIKYESLNSDLIKNSYNEGSNFRIDSNYIFTNYFNDLVNTMTISYNGDRGFIESNDQLNNDSTLIAKLISGTYGEDTGNSVLEVLNNENTSFINYSIGTKSVDDSKINQLSTLNSSLKFADTLNKADSNIDKAKIQKLFDTINFDLKTYLDLYSATKFADAEKKKDDIKSDSRNLADEFVRNAIVFKSTSK